MFVIIDTNHYRELAARTVLGEVLEHRLNEHQCDAFTTIITVQEITQGWLAEINRKPAGREQVRLYSQFHLAIQSIESFTVLDFDGAAAEAFHHLPTGLRRIGTMDLKIAAIAMSHDALLLSRNLVHFEQVPGLRVENWLE